MNAKMILASAAIAASSLAQAAAIAFNGIDSTGSGDMSVGSQWAGESLPGTSAEVNFNKAGTVTASTPVSFGTVNINAAPVVFRNTGLFTVNGDWLMTSWGVETWVTTGSVVEATGRMKLSWTAGANNSKLHVVGAGARFTMKSATQSLFGSQSGARDNLIHVADGGEANFTQLWYSYSGDAATFQTNNNILVETGGKMTLTGGLTCGGATKEVTTGKSGYHCVAVRSGGELTMNGEFKIGGDYSPSNVVAVSGENSLLSVNSHLTVGSTSEGNTMTVSDGATLQARSTSGNVTVGDGETANGNTFGVTDGSSFEAAFDFYVGKSGSRNLALFDEARSLIVTNKGAAADIFVGYEAQAHGNALIVSNTPTFLTQNITVGEKGYGNRFVTYNCADRPYLGSIAVGNKAGAHDNVAILHGTGTWSRATALTAPFAAATTNNVFRMEGFRFPSAGVANPNISMAGTGNSFELGEGLDVTTYGTLQLTGGHADGCRVLLDGATWRHIVGAGNNARTYFNYDNHLVLDNGAKMLFTNLYAFSVGNVAATFENMNNLIEVRNGSEMRVSDLRIMRSCNRLVVSNATMFVDTYFNFPEYRSIFQPTYGTHGYCTNNILRLEGSAPRFVTTVGMGFTQLEEESVTHVGHTHIEFLLPDSPYAKAPLEGPSVTFPKTTTIRVDLDGYRAVDRRDFLLAEATGEKGVVTVSDLDELSSELPSRCRLYLTADKKQLRMKVKGSGRGLILLLR